MSDVEEVRAVAVAAARKAGAVLRQHFAHKPAAGLVRKGVVDLVTDADRAAEQVVIATLRARFPEHEVLSEEAGGLPGRGPLRWIIDPLDGTTNFAHGVPHFAVLVAAQERATGDLLMGVTYDPMRDELFVAEHGQGATLNGAPMHVSTTAQLQDALLATGFPYDRLARAAEDDNHREFCRLNLMSRGVRRMGAAGLDLAYLACGRYDAYWEVGLKPWDMAGGILMVAEAGGQCSTLNGGTVRYDAGETAASNGALHDSLLTALENARRLPINSRAGLS